MRTNFSKRISYFLIFFLLITALPVLFSLSTAILNGSKSFHKLFTTEFLLLLEKSIWVAFASALFSTLSGILLGFILFKTKQHFHPLIKIIILFPLLVSPYVIAVAWRDLFVFLFHGDSFFKGLGGLIFIYTTIFSPLAMLIIGNALGNINASIEESALLIVPRIKVLWKIVLPLIRHAIISSFVLIFIFVLSEFSVPAYFGVKVFTTEIFTQFSAFYNQTFAIIESLVLVLISVLLLFSERKYLSDAPFLSVGDKGNSNKEYDFQAGGIIISLWILIFFFLPFAALTYNSFASGFTLFAKALILLGTAILNSFSLAFLGAFVVVFSGLLISYYISKSKNALIINISEYSLLILFAIPSIILGISLVLFFNKPYFNFIYSSWAIVIIAYAGKFTFLSSKIIGNSLKQIPKSFEEAASVSGVSEGRIFVKVYLPLLSKAIFAAFIIGFVLCFSELGTTILIYPPGLDILSIKIFTLSANSTPALTSAMNFISFFISFLFIFIFSLLSILLNKSTRRFVND